jgi:transposase
MEVVYPRCAGLDVHKKKVVACRVLSQGDAPPCSERRTFGTMTDELLALSDWLAEAGVTHVAMESTGVYWKPVYNVLEGSFTLLVVNAQHIKAVPGRKTDVKDAEWIADLLRHGLLRGSFVPERPQRELRELTRYRSSLVRERTAEVNRLHKTLESANIKLSSVATNILGRSGREILTALVAGQNDAQALAQLARGALREKIPELERALVGRFGAHERFLVARQLAHIDDLDALIEEISEAVRRRLATLPAPPGGAGGSGAEQRDAESAPNAAASLTRPDERGEAAGSTGGAEGAIARLETIPGVGRRTAEILVAELGLQMERFPTYRHIAAWAGMAPGNRESAGKRQSSKTRKGSPWLRAILVEAAKATVRTDSYLAAQYRRLKGRRGAKRAAVAVGHSILVIAYHLLKHGTTYEELGANYFDERESQRVAQRAVTRLQRLGYVVTLAKAAA